MDVIHDLLDKQVVNRNGHNVGRVDGIVAELRSGAAPRLVAIEMGSVTLARRVGGRLAVWAGRLQQRWSPARRTNYRIPFSRLHDLGGNVTIDIDMHDTPAYAWESWLRRHILDRIPGKGKGK
jgi:sporulation protein YlmC with PRC-barrel domain